MNLEINQTIKNSFVVIFLCLISSLSFAQLKIEPQNLLLPSGETAIFKVTMNSSKPLQYQWLKNGQAIEGANESTLTYENVQLIEDNTKFQVIINDGTTQTESESALLRVTANNRPHPSIVLSPASDSYAAGDTIFFKGDVMDIEEGVLKPSAFTWAVELYQNDQLYSVTSPTSGIIKGYVVIPRDPKLAEDAWYRITLTGTDTEGLSQRTFYDVFPEKTQFELQTSPEGLDLKVDGKIYKSPFLANSIKGMKWNIAAPKLQRKNGKLFSFVEWSDGFAASDYPLFANESFLMYAIYEEISLDSGTGLLGRYFENEEQYNSNQPSLTKVEEMLVIESDTVDNHMVKEWIGEVKSLVSDWHEFEVASDGNVRLYVDNQLLIDRWNSNTNSQKTAKIKLERGKSYPIHLEVKNANTLGLFWSTTSLSRSVVPKNQLFPAFDEGNTINIKHYTNSREGTLTLQLSKLDTKEEDLRVRLLDIQGRTYVKEQFALGKGLKTITINMRFFFPGIYYLEIRGAAFREVIKVPKR